MYNVDESGLTVVQSKTPQVVGHKGKRQVASVTSCERGSLIRVVGAQELLELYIHQNGYKLTNSLTGENIS